jgi:putative solute:sodium symporter small subunit
MRVWVCTAISLKLIERVLMQQNTKQDLYWRKNLMVTAILLIVWFAVSFVLVFFSRELTFNFFGWPFSFWVAAQGALVVYCLIIWYYAHFMNRLDQEYGITETEG